MTNITSTRFEAVYYEEEYGERSARWEVIEWVNINSKTGSKSGHSVKTFRVDEEHLARELEQELLRCEKSTINSL